MIHTFGARSKLNFLESFIISSLDQLVSPSVSTLTSVSLVFGVAALSSPVLSELLLVLGTVPSPSELALTLSSLSLLWLISVTLDMSVFSFALDNSVSLLTDVSKCASLAVQDNSTSLVCSSLFLKIKKHRVRKTL